MVRTLKNERTVIIVVPVVPVVSAVPGCVGFGALNRPVKSQLIMGVCAIGRVVALTGGSRLKLSGSVLIGGGVFIFYPPGHFSSP